MLPPDPPAKGSAANLSVRDALVGFGPEGYAFLAQRPAALLQMSHPFEYVSGPALEGDRLFAVLRIRSGGVRVAVEIKALAPSFFGVCSRCGRFQRPCEHLNALVGDLAMSPELREALLAGEPVKPALDAVAAARRKLYEEAIVDGALARWTMPRTSAQAVTLEVKVEGGDDDDFGEGGSLLMRFRAPPARRVLEYNELFELRLSPEMRRVLALCEPDYGRKRGVRVGIARVASVLELLRAHPEWPVQGLKFVEKPLRLGITRELRADEEDREVAHYLLRRPTHRAPAAPKDTLVARWRSEDGSVDLAFEEALLFPGPTCFVQHRKGGPLFPVDPSVDVGLAQRMAITPVLPVPRGAEGAFFQQLKTRFRGHGVALPPRAAMGLPEVATPDFEVRIDGSPLDFEVLLDAVYSTGTVAVVGDADELAALAESGSRDDDLEHAAAMRLVSAGLVWDGAARRFRPPDEDAAVAFWESGVAELRGDGAPRMDVYLSDRLVGVRVRGALRPRIQASLVGGWLETRVSFEADEVSAERTALREALARKRKWVLLEDGTIARMAAGTGELSNAMDALLDDDGECRLSVAQVGLLDHWAGAAEHVELDAKIEQLRARLRAVEVRPAEVPADFQATLRPYQVQGLAWLQFLDELGTGGILADDMGLGKTLMTLAFLLRKKETKGAAPSLVVCPTSVVGNWIREAARFAPGLSVLSLAGSNRGERFSRIAESDLVLTTYALLRIDAERLSGFDFRAIVLDEAQNIKNATAATTHAARRLRGEQKLALTGTPVENRLGELWSILDVCNPGMLGSERSFQQRFERALASDPGGPAAAELRARVRPFLLRRTKAQVLTDLPPKEEIDIPCIPGPAQRVAYDVLADMMRRAVESSIATRGFGQSGIQVLTAMLRLRQMCCDPRLVDPNRPASQSAKREAFLGLVRELVAEGRRALVFSQFVELLQLWRGDLDREGIEYVYLDGSTIHRDAVVARFQEGRAPLFLLSLKAGGAGLNLTAADTVIHCDPWWNPAVEAQATDRSHRIGQRRAVTVYRLVLSGSIEEKIVELKARKRAIAEAVVREDTGEMRGLDEDDVRLLLSGVDAGGELEVAVSEEPSEAPREEKAAPARVPVPVEQGPSGGVLEGEALKKLGGEVLAYLRETGETQRDFAFRARTSQATVSRLMRGELGSLDRAVVARMEGAMTKP